MEANGYAETRLVRRWMEISSWHVTNAASRVLPVLRVRAEGRESDVPLCKTRYKRLKGSQRVEGDDDEEDIDDIEHEFNIKDEENKRRQLQLHPWQNKSIMEEMLYGKMSYGRGQSLVVLVLILEMSVVGQLFIGQLLVAGKSFQGLMLNLFLCVHKGSPCSLAFVVGGMSPLALEKLVSIYLVYKI